MIRTSPSDPRSANAAGARATAAAALMRRVVSFIRLSLLDTVFPCRSCCREKRRSAAAPAVQDHQDPPLTTRSTSTRGTSKQFFIPKCKPRGRFASRPLTERLTLLERRLAIVQLLQKDRAHAGWQHRQD